MTILLTVRVISVLLQSVYIIVDRSINSYYCNIKWTNQFTAALTILNISAKRSKPLKKFLQVCQN